MNLRYIDLDENLLTRGSDGTYYRLRIGQDDWIDSPRDWSPLGHMLCWSRRYNLGDKHDYSEPIDFWHDMVREHIDRNTLFDYALSGDGSVRLQKEIDEDGEESYELCYWGYISFLADKQKASWCIDKTYVWEATLKCKYARLTQNPNRTLLLSPGGSKRTANRSTVSINERSIVSIEELEDDWIRIVTTSEDIYIHKGKQQKKLPNKY